MPWPKDHKSDTRDRIVASAAAAFRAEGVAAVRIDDVMSKAGLTHGGFYAHFSSKQELLARALEFASVESERTLASPLEPIAEDRRFEAVVNTYLSARHAEHPERGCPLASLGPEIARTAGGVRRQFARAVERRLRWMLSLRPGRGSKKKDEEAVGTLACMVGGLILARALDGKDRVAILDSCRRFIHRALEADR